MSKDNEDNNHGSQYWNRSLESRLTEIISLFKVNNTEIKAMAIQLQTLTQEVNNSVQTQQLVISLLTRIVEFISNNTTDPVALTNLANILKDTTAALSAAASNASAVLPPV